MATTAPRIMCSEQNINAERPQRGGLWAARRGHPVSEDAGGRGDEEVGESVGVGMAGGGVKN